MQERTYGGSTELETESTLFLKNLICVYFEGNPRAPACSWVVYGEEFVTDSAKSIMLNWRAGNHFEIVNKI